LAGSVPTDSDAQSCRVVAGCQCRVLDLQPDRLTGALLWVKTAPMSLKEPFDALSSTARYLSDLFSRWGWQSTKDQSALRVARVLPNVDAVQGEDMVVDVQSDSTVDPLYRGHCTRERVRNAREAELLFGPPLERVRKLGDKCAQYSGTELPVVTEQSPQAPRERADPVPDGDLRQYLSLKVCRSIGHAPAEATCAKTAAFAAKGYKLMVATDPTFEQKATPLGDSAVEKLLELSDDEPGQPALLLHPLAKAWPVLSDGLVQDTLFRPVTGVAVVTCGVVG
jgi:hypothetical protein